MRLHPLLAALVASCILPAAAEPRLLGPGVERQWVRAVLLHRTDDGTTVETVLRYVQAARPREFRYGQVTVGYDGATGAPVAVGIDYWIGQRRLAGQSYANLSYDVSRAGSAVRVMPTRVPLAVALQHGRATFLAAVDDAYARLCLHPNGPRKFC